MKNRTVKLYQKLFGSAAAVSMVVSGLGLPVLAAEDALVNAAAKCEIVVPSAQNGKPASNLTDGNLSTLWVNNGAQWPCDLIAKTPDDQKNVKKVVLKFESGHSAWAVDVSVSHLNEEGVYVEDRTVAAHGFDDALVVEFDEAIATDAIKISLDNPKNGDAAGGFWPALAELEVWVDENAGKEELDFENITSQCALRTSADSQNPLANLCDGNPSTLWVSNGANWPCTVTAGLPDDIDLVSKVVIKFESGHSAWAVDVALSHKDENGEEKSDISKTGHGFDDVFVYEFETPVSARDISVTLSNPKNGDAAGAFWPAMAELEIYGASSKQNEETRYYNVAPFGSVSQEGPDGNNSGANLIDDNNATMAFFKTASMGNASTWMEVNLDQSYDVAAIETVFEQLEPDPNNFVFKYDILGQAAGSDEWITLFEDQSADRSASGHIQRLVLDEKANLKKVRIVLNAIDKTGGDPWPAMMELRVLTTEERVVPEDPDNVAKGKSVHANYGQATAANLTDGNTNSRWTASMYPAYADIDLEGVYALDEISVLTPTSGSSRYSIYTSIDGRDFSLLAQKEDGSACPEEGLAYAAEGTKARYVRLFVEYESTSANALVREVKVRGEKLEEEAPVKDAISVADYDDTDYASASLTAEDTINEVRGIISRQIGEAYQSWFEFELADQANGYDYFELSNANGKIHVKGNNGVSLATGLNHYLKYICDVNISQVSKQVSMPEALIPVDSVIHKETNMPVRYAYNFCTLSYSMSFWGEKEWRDELDWLALNGVNLVLDPTGEEEVWRRFLNACGYSDQEAKDFIAGPGYYGWFYMANLSGMGGPVHDSWFEKTTELARKNHLWMQRMGMQPVLQGFCGMVPEDFTDKQPEAKVITQGRWNQFQRPYMLQTTDACFEQYADLFYQCQKDVFGDVSDYYATDPFHEGGNTGGMNVSEISRKTLASMMKNDPDAVWVIQSWISNPSAELINGLGSNKDHALVLDLYAEKTPHWNSTGYGGKEFGGTPWVYCMLNNFGGRLGLHGHIDNFVSAIPNAVANANHLTGIGITPEASINNPVLYDLFFETIWTDDADNLTAIDTDKWLGDYTERRYGAASDAAKEAFSILEDTVYKASNNMKGQGAPESIVNARPAMSITAASTWGNSVIDYNKEDLEHALELLLEDYDLLKDSEGYQYDLANVTEQVLSNSAQELHKVMVDAFSSGDVEKFDEYSAMFLDLIDQVETVTGSQSKFMLGTWTNQAKRMAEGTDDFTNRLFMINARALITTWGSINQCNGGLLNDYSNRQWSGLTKDYYKARWEKWIEARKKEMAGEPFETFNAASWFAMEWDWVLGDSEYTEEPNGADLQAVAANVLDTYSVTKLPKIAAEEDANDIRTNRYTMSAGSAEPNNASEGDPAYAADGSTGTIWHTLWNGDSRDNLWIDIELDQSQPVSGLRYQPRQGGGTNGIITSYRIAVSNDNGATYTDVATGNWANSASWKSASFDPVNATNIRLYAVESISTNAGKIFASAAEIRAVRPDLAFDALDTAINSVDGLNEVDYTADSWAALQAALIQANSLKKSLDVIQPEIDAAAGALTKAKADLVPAGPILNQVTVIFMDGETELARVTVEKGSDVTAPEAPVKEGYVFKGWDAGLENVTSDLIVHAIYEKENPVAPVDKEALNEAVEAIKAEGLEKADWTEESFAALEAALESARTVLADADASQDDVNAALEALNSARSALKADRTDLENTLASISNLGLDAADYTKASWTEFSTALEAAQTLLNKDDAMPSQLKEAKASLENALSSLKADTSALEKKIADIEAENLKEEDHEAEGWSVFAAALANAKDLLASENPSAADIKKAHADLHAARAALVKKDTPPVSDKADKDALTKAVDAISKLNAADYTEASWSALQSALADAKAILEDENASQASVDQALQALENARIALEPASGTDTKALEAAIRKADALKADNYTPESWTAFQSALAKAKEVLGSGSLNQADADQAAKALEAAMEALKPAQAAAADTSKLAAALKKAEALKEADYTSATWKSFAKALESAKAVIKANDPSQAEVDQALGDLENAMKDLKKAQSTTDKKPSSTDKKSASTGISGSVFGALSGAALAALAIVLKKRNHH